MADLTAKTGAVVGLLSSSTSKSKSKHKVGGGGNGSSGGAGGDYVTTCGPLTILANFDSGNFLKAELVQPPESSEGDLSLEVDDEDLPKVVLSSSRPVLKQGEFSSQNYKLLNSL